MPNKTERIYFVYLLKCEDKTFYTGITRDLERRVFEHNNTEKGAKYTKGRRPVKLVFSKKCKNRSDAQKEEYRIRSLTRKEKQNLCK